MGMQVPTEAVQMFGDFRPVLDDSFSRRTALYPLYSSYPRLFPQENAYILKYRGVKTLVRRWSFCGVRELLAVFTVAAVAFSPGDDTLSIQDGEKGG